MRALDRNEGARFGMEVFPIGLIVFAVGAYMLLRRAEYTVRAMVVTATLAASSAVTLAGTNVLVSYIALMFFALWVLRRVVGMYGLQIVSRTSPGFWSMLYALYALVGAMVFPTLFRGLPVFGFAAGADDDIVISYLSPGMSNISQTMYLLTGIAASFFMAMYILYVGRLKPAIIALYWGMGALIAFGLIDFLNLPGSDALFAFVRTASYRMLGDATMQGSALVAGLPRVVGPHSEASQFASALIGYFAFAMSRGLRTQNWRILTAAGVSGALLILSTSSTAYGAILLLGGFFGLYHLAQIFLRGSARSVVALYLCAMAGFMLIVLMWVMGFIDLFWAYFNEFLIDKAASDSGQERGEWNAQAVYAFINTFGIGAGVGSLRTSGLFFAIIGCLGVVGIMTYLLYLRGLFTTSPNGLPPEDRDYVFDLKWGVLGFLCASSISLGSLNTNMSSYLFMGMLIGACALSQRDARALAVRRGPGPQHAELAGALR